MLEDSLLGRILDLFKPKKIKRTKKIVTTRKMKGPEKDDLIKSKHTLILKKRVCPKCMKELKDEPMTFDFSKLKDLPEGETLKLKCPHCGHEYGKVTAGKKISKTFFGKDALKKIKEYERSLKED